MVSMGYCRHENTAIELAQVWDMWEDYDPGTNEWEDRGRAAIIRMVHEMHQRFEFDGTYEGMGIETDND